MALGLMQGRKPLKWTNGHLAGLLPAFVHEDDPRSAVDQLHSNYAHGGGWNDFEGFTLRKQMNGRYFLVYPGDPNLHEVARAVLRDETIVMFQYAWVAVIQKSGDYRIARLD